jgi:hypothetical protein
MNWNRLAFIVICLAFTGCDSTPKLDATNDATYDKSFKEMFKALSKEDQRKLRVDLGVIATAAQNAKGQADLSKGMGSAMAASMSPSVKYKDANGLTAEQIHDKAVQIKNDRTRRN